MASSESMDDSFRGRVEKVFGSLASTKSLAPESSMWSLTDEEVERREWRRGKDTSDREDMPCSSSFDEFLKKEKRYLRRNLRRELEEGRDDLDDDDGGDEQSDRSFRGGNDERDEWEIRSSIGLDSTLDHEEEEDEYDKVATGRENAGDRLFMGDVTHHGSYLNAHNVLPSSLHGTTEDMCADHVAAIIRLNEDEAEAQKNDSVHVHDPEVKEQHIEAAKDCNQLRPILKRKDNNAVSRPQKRVRFDPGCKYDSEDALEKSLGNPLSEATVSDAESLIAHHASSVPDYLLNPSRYTRYSFDSTSEFDEESNAQACMDFLSQVKMSEQSKSGFESAEYSANLPKSITFIPKKKARDAKAVSEGEEVLKQNEEEDHEQSLHGTGFPVGIAAGEAQHEVSAMEEEQAEINVPAGRSASFQKPGRSYRTKPRSDDHEF